jgi:hypothetical protein
MNNTGHRSTGNHSTGNHSTGNYSTGHYSTGHCSTGAYSTGDCSTGDRSTGHNSTGNWSISNNSTGHFSTEDYSGFSAFNKPCSFEDWDNAEIPSFLYFDLTKWIEESEMSDKEKEENENYATTNGYLKVFEYEGAWKNTWDNACDEDKNLLYALPNFDADVFKEISGIDVNQKTKELTVAEIEALLGYKIKIIK